MTLAVMLFPSWLTRPIGSTRAAVATVIAIALGAVVILLGGRALWLAIIVASLLVLAPRAGPWFKGQSSAIRITLVSILAVATFATAVLGGSIVDRLLTSSTIGQRLAMWGAALDAWLERPLNGYGPGAFPWILQTTSYFETNSIHPRHPDSVPFQLLPEAGLLGIAAAAIILIAIGWAMWRRESRLALWPVAVFVVSGIGANPTDFPFLVVTAVVWAALALPRTRNPAAGDPASPLWRPISSVGLALLATATVLTLAASIAYRTAEEHAGAGDTRAARQQLGVAITLDPGMGLYRRERGVANLLLDEPARATADLRKATEINPSDDLASRLLSIALHADHQSQAASDALGDAIALKRSDQANLALLARRAAEAGDARAVRATLAEFVLAWPTVIGAPGWDALLTEGVSTVDVVDLAIERWQHGLPTPEPLRGQPLWLSAVAGRDDLKAEAADVAGASSELAEATFAVMGCEPNARAILRSISQQERESAAYWALRIQQAGEEGVSDLIARDVYRLLTNDSVTPASSKRRMNALVEINAQGSVDAWGYHRGSIEWMDPRIELPLPEAGASRWLQDPVAARSSAGIQPGSCEAL
jgi:tetratricopeptide (TPR) repeat protein